MKKINDIVIILGIIIVFFISRSFDSVVNDFFGSINIYLLNSFFEILTNFIVVSLILLIIPAVLLYKKKKDLVYLLFSTYVIAIVLTFTLKLIFLRQRPLEALTYPEIQILNYSFPSTHSAVAFSLLPILLKYLSKYKAYWIAIAVLIAFSRIYLSNHFLSDVIFGSFFGYLIGDTILDYNLKGKILRKK